MKGKRSLGLLLVAVLVVAMSVVSISPMQANPVQAATVQAKTPDLAVVMTTFTYQGSDGKWLGESGPFLNELGDKGKDVSDTLPYCDKAVEGVLFGRHVLLITTGTTKVPASQCAMNFVMSPWITKTKEVILTGISGFSPRVGGYIDSVGMPVPGEITEIGDVCISPVVVNELAFMSLNREKYWPLNWPNPSSVGVGSMELAKAIYESSKHVAWPELTAKPKANVLKYFGGDEEVLRLPKAWFGNCAELTSDIFWHGAKDDQYARLWVTGPLNEAFGTSLKPGDVVVSTAMETISIFAAIQKYNELNHANVPVALVRSSSNMDQPWVGADMEEAVGPAESINAGMSQGGDEFGALTEYLIVRQYLMETGK